VNAQGQWRDLKSDLPWVRAFGENIQKSPLPALKGKEIIIATDSSGLHRENPFEVLGFVIFDFDSSVQWELLRQSVRRNILKDSRRMAFKNLKENVRQRALPAFLQAADQMIGLCLCVAINKRISHLGGGRQFFDQLVKENILKTTWKLESFERAARMTHFISLLIAGLCTDGQNVFWISDEDEMFESPEKSEDTLRLLTMYQKLNVQIALGTLRAGTTKMDIGDRFEEDITAIADIGAGAFGELVMKLKPDAEGSIANTFNDELISDISGKSNLLLSWLADDTQPLKRISLLFDHRSDGKFRIAKFWNR
jgi:hypothetical protein